MSQSTNDDPDEEMWVDCKRDEDYSVTTNQFRTEMHRLAARETKRREAMPGETQGVICRTTEAREDSISVRFDLVPFEATPGFKDRRRKETVTEAGVICRETMPPHTKGMPVTGMTCVCQGAPTKPLPPPALPVFAGDHPLTTLPTEPIETAQPTAVATIQPEVIHEPMTEDDDPPALGNGFGGLSFDEWLATQGEEA